MRQMKLIAILGFISLVLGGLAGATGCSDGPERLEVDRVEITPRADIWEESSEPEIWKHDVGQDVDESTDISSPLEPGELASITAAALSRYQLANFEDGDRFGSVKESNELTVRVDLPGKELVTISETFESFEEFVGCLRRNQEDACVAESYMQVTLAEFDGINNEGVRACNDGCCQFTYGRVWQEGLTIREICYDSIEDDRLSVTELRLSVD